MLKNNKIKLLLSSLAILVPTVVALILKDSIESGMKGAWHFSWILPVTFVLTNVLLHAITLRENERVGQHAKIVNMTYWILPAISFYISAVFMALSLGWDINVGAIVSVVIGISFILIGNYSPKTVRNRFVGIKLKWTIANDDNWAATHRFAGRLWVICGIAMLPCAFLPFTLLMISLMTAILVSTIPPIVYSYIFYKKQLAEGSVTKEDFTREAAKTINKKAVIIVTVISSIILIGVMVMMFVGSITYTVGEDELSIKTTYGGKMTLDYDDIESIDFIDGGVDGKRVSGFASAKLLYGWFKNDDLGDYTRYTYTDCDAAIIIRTSEDILVIAEESSEDTMALYLEILKEWGKI